MQEHGEAIRRRTPSSPAGAAAGDSARPQNRDGGLGARGPPQACEQLFSVSASYFVSALSAAFAVGKATCVGGAYASYIHVGSLCVRLLADDIGPLDDGIITC